MQILPSMTISTLKLYGRKQPMRPWSLFNSFQRTGKGTLQLSHLNSLVQSRCPQQSVLSLMDALSGLHCGSGSVPSSAGRSLALSSCTSVITGTDCDGKYAPVAIRASAVLQLQMCCDCVWPCGPALAHWYLMFCRSLWSLPVVNHLISRLSAYQGR